MKTILIDNNDSFTYNLAQIIEETGLTKLDVRLYEEVNDKMIELFDKIVISPGPGIPSDFPKLEKFIKKFFKRKSILGICLGFEAIGLAFGGEIINSGCVFHGVTKQTIISNNHHYLFCGITNKFKAGLYHSWILNEDKLPAELEIIARADDRIIMAVSHKKYDIIGVQFHPESIMTEYGKVMITNWLNNKDDIHYSEKFKL